MAQKRMQATGTLLKHLQDNFTTVPVRYPNKSFNPLVHGPNGWVWATVQFSTAIQETIVDRDSDAGQRIEGFLFLQAFVKRDTGLQVIDPVCDELADLFNKQALPFIDSSGLTVQTGVPSKVLIGDTPDGVWYQQNVDIQFHYHLK